MDAEGVRHLAAGQRTESARVTTNVGLLIRADVLCHPEECLSPLSDGPDELLRAGDLGFGVAYRFRINGGCRLDNARCDLWGGVGFGNGAVERVGVKAVIDGVRHLDGKFFGL